MSCDRSIDHMIEFSITSLVVSSSMNLSAPLRDIVPGVRGELLDALIPLVQPVSRRRLAELAEVSAGHASSVISDLVLAGIVNEVQAGGASLVSLNRSHLATSYLEGIAGLGKEFISRLSQEIGRIDAVLGAWLFGSVARGDASPESDVDILIVSNNLESVEFHRSVSDLHINVRTWTGNDLEVVEHSSESFESLVEDKNPLIESIVRDGIALCEISPAIKLHLSR